MRCRRRVNGAENCTPTSAICATAYGGSLYQSIPITTNAWHSLIVVLNGASSTYKIDGNSPVTFSVSTGTNGTSTLAPFAIGQATYGYLWFVGDIEEVEVYGAGLSGTQQTAVWHNACLFYTLSMSC